NAKSCAPSAWGSTQKNGVSDGSRRSSPFGAGLTGGLLLRVSGMSLVVAATTTATPQPGHFTRLPASSSFTLSFFPQGQAKTIGMGEDPVEECGDRRRKAFAASGNDPAPFLRRQGRE